MKVRSNQPVIPTAPKTHNQAKKTTKLESATIKTSEESPRAATSASRANGSSTATDGAQSKLAERNIVTTFMRDRLVRTAVTIGKPQAANPAEGSNVLTDPRQHSLDNGAGNLGAELAQDTRGADLLQDLRGPIGGDGTNINTEAPSGDDRPDPLHGEFDAEERFGQRVSDRISQRSSGQSGEKDPNSQSDGNAGSWAGLTFAGLAGTLVSGPVGVAGAIGAAIVGGLNYVYDDIIEDMDNDVPDTVDHEVVNDQKVQTDEVGGDGGGGDVSDETENEATLEYVLAHPYSTPHPDDPSGDNPNGGWAPNLTTKPAVDARDTVSTPADPYGATLTAEEIQARIDALGRFSPRTQNAINPGDQDGEVGGDPDAAPPADLPDEWPVGDPGSPGGPSQPNE